MAFDLNVILRHQWALLEAAGVTLHVCAVALALGAMLGFVLCLGKLEGSGLAYRFCAGFIDFFRTVPEMVVIFWVYSCLPLLLSVRLSALVCGIIALTLYAAAFLAEIFRAGIQSVPRGQVEAGQALGLPTICMWRKVILPPALRNMLPAFMNFLTQLLKASALLSAIGVGELVYRASVLGGQTYRYFELLTAVAVIYFAIIFPLSMIARAYEARMEVRRQAT